MAADITAKAVLLSRFILRLDRIKIPLWLFGITFFTLVVPPAFINLYGNDMERQSMADTMANPAMIAMVGPGDLDNYSIGAMTAHQMLLLTAVVVGLMSILLVARHTRGDEEDGRLELIRSLPVGRLSYLNATLIVITGVSLLLGLLNAIGLYAMGVESMGLEGSVLYGAVFTATGLFFAGVTAVFAQLSESSRGTVGYSIAVLLLAYLFRAVTDVSNDALSWLSPLGWVTKTEVYWNNNWGPLFLMIAASLILFAIANYLNAVRDLERGFIPTRKGKTHASAFLLSPLGLSLRLQRTGIISWAVALFVLGASYGSVFGDLETFFEGNDFYEQILLQADGASLTEQFIPMLLVVMTLVATIPAVMAVNKLRSEEKKNRLEQLLSKAVRRTHLITSYLVISVISGFVMISLSAVGLWSAAAAVMDDPLGFPVIYGAALAYYPAMLVMAGLAAFLIGFFPKLTSLVWMYLLYTFIVLYLGGIFQFEEWVGKLSPFGYVPQLPVEEFSLLPVVLLSVTALILMVAGVIGFKLRDIESD